MATPTVRGQVAVVFDTHSLHAFYLHKHANVFTAVKSAEGPRRHHTVAGEMQMVGDEQSLGKAICL